ncbi:MAG: hypothetical protein H6525_08820 [Actinobacteria bacterium]|nr:hypothetical protein [Actinomycetota bacterium]MCB9412933.1 hypothetical protein [Actinomycetota bacterium]
MTGDSDPLAGVRDPRVAEALERMAAAAGIDLDSMPAVFDDVYRRLQSALAEPEQGS